MGLRELLGELSSVEQIETRIKASEEELRYLRRLLRLVKEAAEDVDTGTDVGK